MVNHLSDLQTLKNFLALPHRAEAILKKFAALPGAMRRSGGEKEGFVYVPGTRENAVLLVAHADTAADERSRIAIEENSRVIFNRYGILGADDRAGCAMLWLLRELGHGLLVTDGEEMGGIGTAFLATAFPELYDELNCRYNFMIQIDRRGGNDFKCYNVGTDEFRAYVAEKTGFAEPNRSSFTDIVGLCRDVCGANLSCGYHDEHTAMEYLVKQEWHHTLTLLRRWLSEPGLPAFPLN